MNTKYIAALAILISAVGCASTTTSAPTSIALEVSGKEPATGLACKDDMDCMLKIKGACANGYSGSRSLQAENGRRVGIMFHCITNAEKAEMDAEQGQ
jgi:hypothetical protein